MYIHLFHLYDTMLLKPQYFAVKGFDPFEGLYIIVAPYDVK